MSTEKAISKRGFTILEVCLVLVIMGIIGASMVPSFGILYKQYGKQFSNTFVLDMQKQRTKGRALPGANYYIKMMGTTTAITITKSGGAGVEPATGYNSYIVGNGDFTAVPLTPTATSPSVSNYVSDPYTGTHPKVSMGMLIDGVDAAGKEVYFDASGAYTADPANPSNKIYIQEIILGVWVDDQETYNVKIDGVTGKTTWTIL